ncbi:ATP synthase F1 subunit gamma [bacterium]|nr:ATP synthase F1 subunit gamma [bacterium]|tara:strand:+ start:976 stop:1836 length:861 start_codon:yes stop_codon:yes gene_type:complete
MSQLRDIKDRINSVKKTRKMTLAMKMVSAAKFKRFSKSAVSSRFIIHELDYNINQVCHNADGLFDVPLMEPVDSDRDLILVIAGDRGLCGGFNSNILKFSSQYIKQSENDSELMLFGKKAISFFKHSQDPIIGSYENFQETLSIDVIDTIVSECVDLYLSKKYEKIVILYNEFKTAVTTNLISKQLFPIRWDTDDDCDVDQNIIIEPSVDEVLADLCKSYVKYSLYNAFLESSAAEQGARMAAMDAASSNAGDMIDELTLIYNRQRQAQITTELSEIVAGAEALVS